MKRARTVEEMMQMKFDTMEFEGRWLESFGTPARCGVWIMWGNSFNGKTSFSMQLSKYLTQFERVAYDSLEEGASLSMKKALKESNMMEVSRRFLLLDRETIEELKVRLRKRKSPKIVFIDSVQYTNMKRADYTALKEEFGKKHLFIFISHADGKNPDGRVAKFIRYDADVKIRVEGFVAFVMSRFGGGENFTIWEEGAAKYWGDND